MLLNGCLGGFEGGGQSGGWLGGLLGFKWVGGEWEYGSMGWWVSG